MNEHGQPGNNQPEPPEKQFNNGTTEQPEQPGNAANEPSSNNRQFWQGIAWGCIPLVLFLVTTALIRFSQNYNVIIPGIIGLIASILAYIVVLIIAIVYLSRPGQRFIGYGLLTMVLVAPIIGAVGCIVATQPL